VKFVPCIIKLSAEEVSGGVGVGLHILSTSTAGGSECSVSRCDHVELGEKVPLPNVIPFGPEPSVFSSAVQKRKD
jgi:hypothetical protein